MDTLTDRFAMWALRSVATAMLFAGVSTVVAGVPLIGMFPEAPVARTIAGVLFQLSGVFVVSGATAMYLSRARAQGLPNERATRSDAERPRVGGWLIALAIVLVMLPGWLLLRLQPFLAEWSRVIGLLSTFDIYGANANMGGIVLLPLAAALTPPLFELAALLGFVVAPAALLPLLFSRSRRFPRIYIVCSVLLSALVIASLRGADAALLAGEAAEQFIEGTNASVQEDAQLTDVLTRYTSIVGSTAPVLAWALCGYLGWVPGMIFSRRVRTTFASRADDRDSASTSAFDVEAITSPPRFPG